jgi:hypothetical protein
MDPVQYIMIENQQNEMEDSEGNNGVIFCSMEFSPGAYWSSRPERGQRED